MKFPISTGADASPGRWRWTILAMLLAATTINYMDRFTLGVLKSTLMTDLHWTEGNYANVVFCFQLAYAIGLVTVSRIVDLIGTRMGLALVVCMIGCAAASHSFISLVPVNGTFTLGTMTMASTVVFMCIARFALGFAEAGTWPAAIKTVSEWFPRKERSVGTGVVNSGSAVGATVTPLIVPVILSFLAWPFVFLVTASLDFVLLTAWLLFYRTPDRHPRLSAKELAYIRSDPNPPQGKLPWSKLFGHRQTWAFVLAKGLSDPIFWFYLFWVPGFLSKLYVLPGAGAAATAKAMALPIMVIYIMADIGSIGGGWLSMKLINLGWSINAARKTVMLGCALCVLPVPLVTQSIGLWPSVLLIGLAAAAHLGFSANLFTVATDTVPKHAVGSLAGLGGMAAAVGGMFIAKLVGWVLDTTGSYVVPFVIAACVYPVALTILHVLLPHLEPMKLKEESPA
jgi:ACS family hexuronate transporter-like MFS transporter